MTQTPPPRRKTGKFELPRGTEIGKYEILRKIATGGMAEIYLARARGTHGFEKVVVLKRILPHVAEDPKFVTMFLDEARLAATLQHPNIADVYDVGDDDGTYFFTMEFVHGQDIRSIRIEERKREQKVPLAITLALVHGTAAALDYAHEKTGPDGKPLGLVHRDVSSSNVLVSYDGAIKLVDFGIARASSSAHKTRTGTLKGKIPYMSPEQARGLAMDRRSDLWSLGVVLYELTVGRRPFRGDSDFAMLEQIVHVGAKPPSTIVAGYPPELEAIVMKLLDRDMRMRYATGEEVIHDLEQLIAQQRLWVSQKAIGKYMRTLFAERIAAWQAAEQQGVPLAQHVAETITSESRRSFEFGGTPPSMNAVPRPADLDPSQPVAIDPASSAAMTTAMKSDEFGHEENTVERAYADPMSGALAAEPQPQATLAHAGGAPVPIAHEISYPTLRPSRWKWGLAAASVIVGGAIAGYVLVVSTNGDSAQPDKPAQRASEQPVEKPAPAPSPVQQQPPPAPAPAPAKQVAEQPPPAPTPAPPPPPPPEVKPATPVAKASPPPRRATVRPASRSIPKPATKPAAKTETKPEQWDPNSPFLPPTQ